MRESHEIKEVTVSARSWWIVLRWALLAVALAAMPALAAERQYYVSGNFSEEITGAPDTRHKTWGTAGGLTPAFLSDL
jgi:hypothetical protein